MIKILLVLSTFLLSCESSKTAQNNVGADSVSLSKGESAVTKDSVPPCIRAKIDSFARLQPHEQPQSVVEYQYKGKKVYYVAMPCCDFFNNVYDADCKLLGSPDGGFTGRGDGSLPGFSKEATAVKQIWKPKGK